MPEERENYCKLLGLNPFKARDQSDEEIANRIAAMEEKWKRELNTASSDKSKKYQIGLYLKMVPDIRSTMDSTVLKDEEFENARKLLERKATKVRRSAVILHDGSVVVPVAAADKLAMKLNWDNIDGKTLISASGIKNIAPPHPVPVAISTVLRMLNDVGCFTPYEFINRLITMPELNLNLNTVDETKSHDDVRLIYETVSRKLSNIKPGRIANLDAYTQTIRAVKSSLTPDERFDELMRFGTCMRVLKPAFDQMDEDSGMMFTREYIDGLMTAYVNDSGADPELCTLLLEEQCIKRMYPANFSDEESSLGTCPRCRSLITIGAQNQYCPNCGSPVYSTCPNCGTSQTAANRNCIKCGTDLGESVRKAQAYETEILRLLTEGKTDSALDELAGLERDFPRYDAVPALKTRIKDCHTLVSNLIERISYDFTSLNFYDLKKAAEEGNVDFPSLMDRDDVRMRYEEACKKVAEADELCVKAVNAPSEEAMELYIRASEICPDHPDAVEMLRHYPPEGPGEAEVQTNVDVIEMRFEIPEERRGMTFCIYRNEGTYPEVDQSTKPLAEIEGWTFSDKTAEPGVEYYYKIYSKRWGVLSEDYAKCGPALILCEVTNVEIENTDNGFKIMYQQPRGADRVRIWRKEAGLPAGTGDEDEILHDDNGIVFDTDLEGGKTYTYLFVTEYDINGNTERSCGSIFSATTAALPRPINDLAVRWDRKNGNYVASWTGPLNATLYYSPVKKNLPNGCMSVKDLSTAMTRIEPLEDANDIYRFDLPDTTVLYIYPAIISGNTAVIGREFVVANLRPFSNLTKTVDGNTCRISMSWPDEAEYACLEITGRERDGSDRREELEISREDYDTDGYAEFQLGGSADTTVNVYAVYMIEGEEQKSIAVTSTVHSGSYSKVYYDVSTESVKGDRRKTRVVVSFTCEEESVIPCCVMIRTAEGIPLREKDGEVVWESDDPIVLTGGRAECFFVMDKEEAAVERMRLFFPDRRNYNKYRFVHPIYNRRK